MNILHIAPLTFNKSSGLVNVIPKIVEEQNKLEGINSALLNVFQDQPNKEYKFDYFDYKYISDFEENFITNSRYDIVVFHSFYIYKYIKLSKKLIDNDIPYIVIPHGSLMKAAIKSKFIKKTSANILFFNKFIHNAKFIQYLSEGEKEKSLKFNKSSVVIPNGINIPTEKNIKNFTVSNDVNLTFVGRLDIKTKGIDKLLETIKLISQSRKRTKNIHLNIYGPDENGSTNYIKEFIKENNLTGIVELKGPVYNLDKQKAYLDTDIFIQLSRNEGLPTSILEALSYGIPSVVSRGTNLGGTVNQKCGWEAEEDIDQLVKQLLNIIEETSSSQLQSFKSQARKIVATKYTWESVTEMSIKQYGKILDK